MSSTPLVTFSHLRWEFVIQRPQHVMSRIARRRPVLFVEEPVAGTGDPTLDVVTIEPHLRVARPRLPESIAAGGFHRGNETVIARLVEQTLKRSAWSEVIAWLYTPMAIGIARALRPRAILYDCMDELSAFHGAPPGLIERERELLACADVVMTGGPSLYRAKREKHEFVRCFPSSVDVNHFRQAGWIDPAPDQAEIPAPRLGFFGVLDERLDVVGLAALADAHPEWHVVLVGPVVKIDPATLPQRPNLHYLGPRDYSQLPTYLAGWDVCLIPFATNESTRFLSPTKTLEYMAAGKPIVSTPVRDVVEPYGEIVWIGEGADGFVAACEQAMAAPEAERARRGALAQSVLRRTSWDETVRRMEELLRQADVARHPAEQPQWMAWAEARAQA